MKPESILEYRLLSEVSSGVVSFSDDLPVTPNSKFGDAEWSFIDEDNNRLNHTPNYLLRLRWSSYIEDNYSEDKGLKYGQQFAPIITDEMVDDLKIFLATYILTPQVFKSQSSSGAARKEVTVVTTGLELIRFFAYIYLNTSKRKLSDITASDIKRALKTYPYSKEKLYYCLNFLSNTYVTKNLKHGVLRFNQHDIKNMRPLFHLNEYGSRKPLSETEFRFISSKSIQLVASFLEAMGIERLDKTHNQDICYSPNEFKPMFDRLIQRKTYAVNSKDYLKRGYYKQYVKEFSHTVGESTQYINIVQCAAFSVILMYTGARASEVLSFKNGCLFEKGGLTYIKGTLVKGVKSNNKTDDSHWISIDVVQDAIRALEEINRYTGNKFLFCNSVLATNKNIKPFNCNRLRERLLWYMQKLDPENNYNLNIFPHQFRHSFTYQLQKAEVGISYITISLKHFHHRMTAIPSQETTGYGNYRNNLLENATDYSKAKKEMMQGLFSTNAVSPANAEKPVEKAKAFFMGNVLNKDKLDKYLNKLKETDIGYIPTGLGMCTRDFNSQQELKKNPPPCLSTSICDPVCESNVVIPEILANLEGRLHDILAKLEDPSFNYIMDLLEEKSLFLTNLIKRLKGSV